MPPPCFAMLTLVTAGVLSGGTLTAADAIGVIASATALVAARERRHGDMALALGIATGASTIGLVLLPVLLGTAIAHRVARLTLSTFAIAAVAVGRMIGAPAPHASLATLLPADTHILLLAIASGLAAWLAASCSARRPLPRELDAAALLSALALPLFAPIGTESMGLAVALVLSGTRLTLTPIARAANDAPLPLRPTAA